MVNEVCSYDRVDDKSLKIVDVEFVTLTIPVPLSQTRG